MHFIAVERRKYLFFFTSDSYVCFGDFQSGTLVVSCVGHPVNFSQWLLPFKSVVSSV